MKVKVKVKSLSHVQLFATPWTVAYKAPPSLGFSRQEYWSGLPFPSPGDLPYPGVEPVSPALQGDALPSEPPGKSLRVKQSGGQGSWSQISSGMHHSWELSCPCKDCLAECLRRGFCEKRWKRPQRNWHFLWKGVVLQNLDVQTPPG